MLEYHSVAQPRNLRPQLAGANSPFRRPTKVFEIPHRQSLLPTSQHWPVAVFFTLEAKKKRDRLPSCVCMATKK
jgi:hypothetical protein